MSISEIKQKIIDYLNAASEPQSARDIAKGLQEEFSNVMMHLVGLNQMGYVTFPRNGYYKLTEEGAKFATKTNWAFSPNIGEYKSGNPQTESKVYEELSSSEKRLLIWLCQTTDKRNLKDLSIQLDINMKEIMYSLKELSQKNYLHSVGSGFGLTEMGTKVAGALLKTEEEPPESAAQVISDSITRSEEPYESFHIVTILEELRYLSKLVDWQIKCINCGKFGCYTVKLAQSIYATCTHCGHTFYHGFSSKVEPSFSYDSTKIQKSKKYLIKLFQYAEPTKGNIEKVVKALENISEKIDRQGVDRTDPAEIQSEISIINDQMQVILREMKKREDAFLEKIATQVKLKKTLLKEDAIIGEAISLEITIENQSKVHIFEVKFTEDTPDPSEFQLIGETAVTWKRIGKGEMRSIRSSIKSLTFLGRYNLPEAKIEFKDEFGHQYSSKSNSPSLTINRENVLTCQKCFSKMNPNAIFCGICGEKLGNQKLL
jgi:Mn-dependent DtxR family transcriptional regulator